MYIYTRHCDTSNAKVNVACIAARYQHPVLAHLSLLFHCPLLPSPAILLKVPVPVVERTHLPCLQPPTDAVEVESMIARAPCNSTVIDAGTAVVGLTLDAEVHDVIATYGTAVHYQVPRPQTHGVPTLHLEQLLRLDELFFATAGGRWVGGSGGRGGRGEGECGGLLVFALHYRVGGRHVKGRGEERRKEEERRERENETE